MTIKEAVAQAMTDWKEQAAVHGDEFDAQSFADLALSLFEEGLAEWLDANGYGTDQQ